MDIQCDVLYAGKWPHVADMPNAQAMAQSFSLANMVPQAPINNQKSWAGIEKATRKYVMRAAGDVYVITGPIFDGKSETIGAGRVAVPKYLYKLVYGATTGRAWAHWIENSDEARAGRPISYEELVLRTGIEFLPGVRPKGLVKLYCGANKSTPRAVPPTRCATAQV
jgi:endonuclease G